MPDLSALLTEGERLRPSNERHQRPLGAPDRTDPGYRVERAQSKAQAAEDDDDSTDQSGTGPTKLFIYSDIGGWFGVWPEDIVRELASIPGDIELHLHSPGGDAFDGVAIYNAFKQHPGKVYGSVDGLAASAASVIAMACDDLKMSKGSQLMIHDAWGFAQGPAEDMGKMQTFLDKISNSIAEVYADRAGGSAEDWRTAMKAESWYTDKEAVEAGLATRIETAAAAAKNHWDLKVFNHAGRAEAPTPPMPGGRRPAGPLSASETVVRAGAVDYEALAAMTEARLRPAEYRALDALQGAQEVVAGNPVTPAQAAALMHAAALRAQARTPVDSDAVTVAKPTDPIRVITTPAANRTDGPTSTEGGSVMPQAYDPVKMREALGLGPDASDAELTTAWSAAFGAPTPSPTPPAAPGNNTPAPAPAGNQDSLSTLAALARQQGVILMDPAQVDEMRRMAARGQEAYNEQRASKRDAVIDEAIRSGRIALSRRQDWVKAWDAEVTTGGDGTKTRELIESLTPNLVPMEAQGYAGSVATSETDGRYFALYPEDKPQAGGR